MIKRATRPSTPIPAARSGSTSIELLVAMTILGGIVSVALTFMPQQNTGVQSSLEHMSALRNASHAVALLAQDIEALGTVVPGARPSLIHADADVVTFSTGPGAPGLAGILSFFFMADSSTSRSDDYILYRQFHDASPEIVARHLARHEGQPFFSFEREVVGTGNASSTEALPDSLLPVSHLEPLHESLEGTADPGMAGSIRAVEVRLLATNGLVGGDERLAGAERRIALPDAGPPIFTCGSPGCR